MRIDTKYRKGTKYAQIQNTRIDKKYKNKYKIPEYINKILVDKKYQHIYAIQNKNTRIYTK